MSSRLFFRSYVEMMDCLHMSFANCPPGGVHLNKVNLRIGHLRTEMEQLCDELDEDDDDDAAHPQPGSISRIQDTTPTTATAAAAAIRTLSSVDENSTQSAAKEEPTTARQHHLAPGPSSSGSVVTVSATPSSLTPSAVSSPSKALEMSSSSPSSNVTPLTSSSSHSHVVSHGHDKCNGTEDGDADYDLAGPLGDGDRSPSRRVTAAAAIFNNDDSPNRRRLYYSDGGGSSSSSSIAEQTPPSEFPTIHFSLDHPQSDKASRSSSSSSTSRRTDSTAASEGKNSEKALRECHPGTTCSVSSSVAGITRCSCPVVPFIALSALFLYQLLK